jgi:hypothetical protein
MSAVLDRPATSSSATEAPYLIQGIPAELVEHFWPFADPYIKRALDHASGEFLPSDFKRSCMDRSCQLWLISKEARIFGAITTEIIAYPHRKHCRIITLAGTDFVGWLEVADDHLSRWAREQGCDALESYVRRGLVPKMQPHGYKQKHAVLMKEL